MPKPVKKKKQFISKKNATTYRLIPGYVDDDDSTATPEQLELRKEEQRKYGIFYDDGYNYMKHMRGINEAATLMDMNSSANQSETQSSYGGSVMFREFISADETTKENIDKDILAALEDAPEVKLKDGDTDDIILQEEEEEFLPDDFINQAGGAVVKENIDDEDIVSGSDRGFSSDEADEGSDFDWEDDEEEDCEQKPSRNRGNAQDDIIEAQTALILKNFEEGLGFSCGAQDDGGEMPKAEDYEGLKHMLRIDKMRDQHVKWSDVLDDHADRAVINTAKYEDEDGMEEEYEWKDALPSAPKYDCVSILSLNSNTRNLPTDIIPPSRAESKKSRQTSTTTNESEHPGLSLKELEEEFRESRKADRASTFRPKDETNNEKKLRKKTLKDERKERRMEKKATKIVFTIEKHKMHREVAALSTAGKGIAMN